MMVPFIGKNLVVNFFFFFFFFFNSSLRPDTRKIFLFLIMQLKDNMNRLPSICVAYKSQICDLSMVESHEGILISFDSFASIFCRCRSSEVSPGSSTTSEILCRLEC